MVPMLVVVEVDPTDDQAQAKPTKLLQPPPPQQANAAKVINTGRPARTGVSWARGYLAIVIDDNDEDDSMPSLAPPRC